MATSITFVGFDDPDDTEDIRLVIGILNIAISSNTAEGSRKAAHDLDEMARQEPELIEGSLICIWEHLVRFAEQVPPDHSVQDLLASIIAELVKLPTTQIEIWGTKYELWKDIPLLEAELRDTYDWHDYKETSAGDYEDAAWINMNSFVARILALDIGLGSSRISEVLQHTLECYSTPSDRDLEAAAELMIRAAGYIYSHLGSKKFADDIYDYFKGGEAYTGSKGLNEERWSFWKQSLRQYAVGRSQKVQERVERALKQMEDAEKSDSASTAETLYE